MESRPKTMPATGGCSQRGAHLSYSTPCGKFPNFSSFSAIEQRVNASRVVVPLHVVAAVLEDHEVVDAVVGVVAVDVVDDVFFLEPEVVTDDFAGLACVVDGADVVGVLEVGGPTGFGAEGAGGFGCSGLADVEGSCAGGAVALGPVAVIWGDVMFVGDASDLSIGDVEESGEFGEPGGVLYNTK